MIRHGESEFNATGQHTGQRDVALSIEGERQAQELGEFLNGRRFQAVYVSPLQRARATCRLAGYGDAAVVVDELKERSYGVYEGLKAAEVLERDPDWTLWEGYCPEGETIDEVAVRAARVLAQIGDPGGDVALFAHGILLRILAAEWIGLKPECGRLFPLDTAAVGILGYERGRRVIRRWNLAPLERRANSTP